MASTDPGIALYDGASIDQFAWPRSKYGDFAHAFLLPLIQAGVTKYIRNARTNLMILSIDGLPIPLTCSDSNYTDTYVCSPYTHYVSYPLHELNKSEASSWRRMQNNSALKTLGALLRFAHVNRTIHVNNWLVSTGLYPSLTASQIERITYYLTARFRNHGVVFPWINERTATSLFRILPTLGYILVASRPIYIFPGRSLRQLKKAHRRHLRKDYEMLRGGGYELIHPRDFGEEDAPRLFELYNLLNIQQHSTLNPQFTQEFFSHLVRDRPIELYGLRKSGRIDAIMGYFELEGTMVSPIIGYDTGVPRSVGLYRMLSSLAFNIALTNGLIDHASAGAASFKRNRGYLGVIEYSAVYVQHLPSVRRSAWSLIRTLGERVAIPYMQRFGL